MPPLGMPSPLRDGSFFDCGNTPNIIGIVFKSKSSSFRRRSFRSALFSANKFLLSDNFVHFPNIYIHLFLQMNKEDYGVAGYNHNDS